MKSGPLLALAASAMLALAGCGGSETSPEEAVKQYIESYDRGDPKAACGDLVTRKFVDDALGGRKRCESQVTALKDLDVKLGTVTGVEDKGEGRSRVRIELEVAGEKRPQAIEVVKAGDSWKVDKIDEL
jgi:hypothetical protein